MLCHTDLLPLHGAFFVDVLSSYLNSCKFPRWELIEGTRTDGVPLDSHSKTDRVFHPDPDGDSALPPVCTDDDLAEVLPYCPNISSAYLSGIRDLSSRTLILLAAHAPALSYLDISGCSEVDALGLHAIAVHSTSLTSLFLSRISSGVTDAALAALVRGLPHLEELEMDGLPLVTAHSLQDVWTYARGLRHWTLSACMHISDRGFPWVPAVLDLPSARARARGIKDENDRSRTWRESLPPLVLPTTHRLDGLRVLDLSHCLRLTDVAILGVAAHAPRIQHLNLAGCIELTDDGLRAPCVLGRHLRFLDLGGLKKVSDRGVFALVSACRRLQSVDVSCEC